MGILSIRVKILSVRSQILSIRFFGMNFDGNIAKIHLDWIENK